MRRVKASAAGSSRKSLEIEVARLRDLDLRELRARWQTVSGRRPPVTLPRHLLFRVLAYRVQAEALGDLDRDCQRLLDRLTTQFGSLKGKRLAVWGLAFKPRTDDMREAPAVPLIKGLLAAGADVQAYDPQAMTVAKTIFGKQVAYAENSYAALTGADALLIVTEWSEFREPDYARMKKVMRSAVIFDGRNIYNPDQIRAHGFTYYSMGRP